MLKTREPAEQQTENPARLPIQMQSLGRRILNPVLSIVLVIIVATLPVALSKSGLLAAVFPVVSFPILNVIIYEFMLAVSAIITAVVVGKTIERRSLAEVGLGRQGLLRHTLLGFGIVMAIICLACLVVFPLTLLGLLSETQTGGAADKEGLSPISQQPGGLLGYVGLMVAFAFVVAVYEEIAYRGLLFRVLEKGVGSWLALAISSLVFGLLHIGNPGQNTLISVAPQMALGLVCAAAYMLTRKLWLPIAIHWAWDILAFAATGTLLTFGDGSSEVETSSMSATQALIGSMPHLIVAIVLLALVVRRGQIRTPRWMQRKTSCIQEAL